MKRLCALTFVGIVMAAAAGCSKKPTAIVEFHHTILPRQQLPEQYMTIAVRNARLEGDTTEFDQSKWSEMTADLVQHNLQRAAEDHGIPIKLVDREHVKLAMEEKDLAAAGITDAGDDVAMAAIRGAKAVLTSKVTIKIDKQKGKGRTIDALGVVAGAWGGGGGATSSEVDKESRNITVQCQFQLKDAGSNNIIVSHSSEPSQHFEKGKVNPFFGGSKTESDMTPRDQIIGQMIDYQLNQFLAKFVPVEIASEIEVEPSSNENSVEAVKALVTDDYETALSKFKLAIAERPDDDKSLFGAGVCCEKLERYDEAIKYYKQARAYDDEPYYDASIDRVKMITG